MRRLYEPYAYGPEARAGCYWQMPAHDWPRVDGDLTTDFAIIGGGYTGLSAALHLAGAGAQAMVLEAESPGWGASGRNGGFCCMGGAKLSDGQLARRFGAAAAWQFHDMQVAAIALVARLLERHGIDADTHSDGEVQLAHRPQAMADLRAEAALLATRGIKATLLSRDELTQRGLAGPGFHGGLHLPLGFALNPAKYAEGLAKAAQGAGARICAHSPVRRISRQAGAYVLDTPGGQVRARRLILATNGYSSEDVPGWLRARFLPVQSNIMVTRVLSPDELARQGWNSGLMAYDSRRLLHYFRLLPDGRFLFGMRGGLRATAGAQAHMQARIRGDFERMFPAWEAVETTHFWSGLACLARGLTPYAGPVDGWENAWAGLAYHGNGVAMATFSGARLAGLALGREQPGAVLGAPLRRYRLGGARRLMLAAAYRFYALRDGD